VPLVEFSEPESATASGLGEFVAYESEEQEQPGADSWAGAARRRWRHLRQIEPRLLLLVVAIALGLWLFLSLGNLASASDTNAWDRELILLMRTPGDLGNPVGPVWLEGAVRDVTALGSSVIVLLISAGLIGFLLLHGDRRTAALLVAAVLGAYVLNLLFKAIYARPRPDIVPALSAAYNASFPSGHSMISAAMYPTIGALLAQLQTRRRTRAYLMFLGLFVTLIVGLSRIYLGVHWPSDVLAGWIAGGLWALLVWSIAHHRSQRSGAAGASHGSRAAQTSATGLEATRD
jgi:undecaprenyl-diphosphatase